MAHQRYEQTKEIQWKHDDRWSKFCDHCKAKNEFKERKIIEIENNR
jgi:hypothetical protein